MQRESPLQREWRARAWAVDPDSDSGALQRALLSPDWALRHMALDALARSPAGVRWARARGVGGTDDVHPNVRAAALELSLWTGRPLDLTGGRGAGWAAEPSESVRRALARHLALHTPDDGQAAARLDLLASLAARVGPAARVARAALFSAGPGAAPRTRERTHTRPTPMAPQAHQARQRSPHRPSHQ